jgi:hypothetical protein
MLVERNLVENRTWKAQVALIRARMEAAVTVGLLVPALYIILNGGTSNQQWAVGVVGVICGYWLRPHS